MPANSMRYLVFLFPLLADVTIACFFFGMPVRASYLGLTDTATGWLFTVFNVTYIFTASVVVRWGHGRMSLLLLLSAGAPALLALLFLINDTAWPLAIAMAGLAISSSTFFICFQLKMGSATSMHPQYSAAWYAFAWSTGMAIGLLLQGVVSNPGNSWFIVPMMIMPLIVVALLLLCRGRLQAVVVAGEADGGLAHDPRYVLIGRISIVTASIVIFGCIGILPKVGLEELDISTMTMGVMLFLSRMAQAISALVCMVYTRWLYNPVWLTVANILGLLGFVLAAVNGSNAVLFCLGLCIAGIFGGVCFYQAVVYAIMDPAAASRHVACNEILVGVGAVAGSLLAGYAAELLGARGLLLAAAAVIGVAMVIEMLVLSRGTGRAAQYYSCGAGALGVKRSSK